MYMLKYRRREKPGRVPKNKAIVRRCPTSNQKSFIVTVSQSSKGRELISTGFVSAFPALFSTFTCMGGSWTSGWINWMETSSSPLSSSAYLILQEISESSKTMDSRISISRSLQNFKRIFASFKMSKQEQIKAIKNKIQAKGGSLAASPSNEKSTLSLYARFMDSYYENTPSICKILDTFLICTVYSGVIQFVYMLLMGILLKGFLTLPT